MELLVLHFFKYKITKHPNYITIWQYYNKIIAENLIINIKRIKSYTSIKP